MRKCEKINNPDFRNTIYRTFVTKTVVLKVCLSRCRWQTGSRPPARSGAAQGMRTAGAEQQSAALARLSIALLRLPHLTPEPARCQDRSQQKCLFSAGKCVCLCWVDPQLNPGWGGNYSWWIPREESGFCCVVWGFFLAFFRCELCIIFCCMERMGGLRKKKEAIFNKAMGWRIWY